MNPESNEQLARQRAAVIWRVRSGAITAAQGAQELGVSRKTYYEWEARAMSGMVAALANQPAGRPARSEPVTAEEKQALTGRIAELEQRLSTAEQSAVVRAILEAYRCDQEKRSAQSERQKKLH